MFLFNLFLLLSLTTLKNRKMPSCPHENPEFLYHLTSGASASKNTTRNKINHEVMEVHNSAGLRGRLTKDIISLDYILMKF